MASSQPIGFILWRIRNICIIFYTIPSNYGDQVSHFMWHCTACVVPLTEMMLHSCLAGQPAVVWKAVIEVMCMSDCSNVSNSTGWPVTVCAAFTRPNRHRADDETKTETDIASFNNTEQLSRWSGDGGRKSALVISPHSVIAKSMQHATISTKRKRIKL